MYVTNPSKGVENLAAPGGVNQVTARLNLLGELEQGFARDYRSPISHDHKTVYGRAVQMMRSDKAKAFDITQESAEMVASVTAKTALAKDVCSPADCLNPT